MYRTSFQCPDTGLMVVARYAFGKVTIEPTGDDLMELVVAQGDATPEDAAQAKAKTAAYCKKYSGYRCSSADEADQYIVKVSEGQTFGFDRD